MHVEVIFDIVSICIMQSKWAASCFETFLLCRDTADGKAEEAGRLKDSPRFTWPSPTFHKVTYEYPC